MALTFTGLRADPPRLSDATDVVANLEADVRLETDGEAIYDEVSFPVAELAVTLTRWMQAPVTNRADFEFDSMSAEEPGLLWIRRASDGWRVGSIHQEGPEPRIFTPVEVDEFVRTFIERLTEEVATAFGLDVSAALSEALQKVT